MNKIGAAVLCVGLTYLGFTYDATWCFIVATIAFFSTIGD